MKNTLKIGILGSGSGSNMQAIQDAVDAGALDARIVRVISDVEGAGILARAARCGIPASFESAAPFRTKLEGAAEERYISILRNAGVELVALAGFMRIVKPAFLAAFPGRVINIHPALLPSFPGVAAWRRALEHGVKITGCTVHFVDAGVDTGRIILQRAVPVLDGDTPESLHARIQTAEHAAYPEALRLFTCAGGA